MVSISPGNHGDVGPTHCLTTLSTTGCCESNTDMLCLCFRKHPWASVWCEVFSAASLKLQLSFLFIVTLDTLSAASQRNCVYTYELRGLLTLTRIHVRGLKLNIQDVHKRRRTAVFLGRIIFVFTCSTNKKTLTSSIKIIKKNLFMVKTYSQRH